MKESDFEDVIPKDKTIELEIGLRLELNDDKNTATIKRSPNIEKTNVLTIPRFVQKDDKKYKVVSIDDESFRDNVIGYLNFEEDVEIESFIANSFNSSKIKKLQIPASVKFLENEWCIGLNDIDEIELSPNNKYYQLINNEFLVGKSKEGNSQFDSLYFISKKQKDVVIPPQIEVIKVNSFENCIKILKSLAFTDDSKLKMINEPILNGSCITKLVLPSSLEFINPINWDVKLLNEIEVSPQSKNFKIIENKYLCTKGEGSEIFDTIVFALRNIEYITISSNIKVISKYAFAHCKRIIEFSFEPNSSLELIDEKGFYDSAFPNDLILPESLIKIENNAFQLIGGVNSVQFLSKKIQIMKDTFLNSSAAQFLFPNAEEIVFTDTGFLMGVLNSEIIVHMDAKITAPNKKKICYYEENEFDSYSDIEDKNYKPKENRNIIPNIKTNNDEVYISVISEDSKSICYKVYDNLGRKFIFRKIFKVNINDSVFLKLTEAENKFAYLQSIQHPFICKIYAMNHYNEGVIFDFEYNDYKLKELIEKSILNDTLKVKIAAEIASAMQYANSKDTFHGNLHIDNIMLNCLFETKIVNFGFQNYAKFNYTLDSLPYVAPEILNDNNIKRNEKVDVYSYGAILYVMFYGKLPKLTLSEKKSGKLPDFPKNDSSITDFGIDLIKKCLSFEPSDRPSFKKISKKIKDIKYDLLNGINIDKFVSKKIHTTKIGT